MLGHRTDVGRLMNAADIFVFPSHFEGTPFAMLEAMAHGLPVVAASFGGAEEILEDDRTGILVPRAVRMPCAPRSSRPSPTQGDLRTWLRQGANGQRPSVRRP